MAKAFLPKQYFKKINNHEIVTKFYSLYSIDAFFEITEDTPRKNATNILVDFYTNLPETNKIEILKDVMTIARVSNEHGANLLKLLETKEEGAVQEPLLECHTDHDTVLYYFTHKKELFESMLFYYTFYERPSYMIYESKEVDMVKAELALTTLTKELTRIATKEDETKVTDITTGILGTTIYVLLKVYASEHDKGRQEKESAILRLIYIGETQEVLVSYTGAKYDKLIYLDTFLRVVTDSAFEGKEEHFDLSPFNKETFEFNTHTQGIPFAGWKIKGITLSYGSDKALKKIKLTLPSQSEGRGMSPLTHMLEELGMNKNRSEYSIDGVSCIFFFPHPKKTDSTIKVPVTISKVRSNLCPLFAPHRNGRQLLKNAFIYKGFIEKAKKEKDEMTKKWEV